MYMLAVTERCRSSKNIIPTNTLLFRNGRTTETDFSESRTPRMTLPSAYLIKNSLGSRAHCITPRRRGSGTVFQRLNSSEKQVSKHFREVKTKVYAQKKAQPCHKMWLCFRNKLEISTEFLSYYFNFSVKLEIKCLFLMPRFQICLTN